MTSAIERDADGVYTGPSEKTFPLRTPVKRPGTNDLTSITLTEPDVAALSAYATTVNSTNDNGIQATVGLIGAVSGIAPQDLQKLKQRDLDALGDWLAVFTKAQPKPLAD